MCHPENQQELVSIFPQTIQAALLKDDLLNQVTEIILDAEKPVTLWILPSSDATPILTTTAAATSSVGRHVLSDIMVDDALLQHVVDRVSSFSEFDNRAGIPHTLHRISRKLDKKGLVMSLTIRVARTTPDLHHLVHDELHSDQSLLLIGPPGAGKTTVLRALALYMGEYKRVEIIDTSCELTSDSRVCHPSVGNCRKMLVPARIDQYKVMIEAVANHNPQCIIIDEITSANEINAALDVSQKGVCLLATTHGITLRSLIENPEFSAIMGSVQTVILSAQEVVARGSSSKSIRERTRDTCFQVMCQIVKPGVIVVITQLNDAVDAYLAHKPIRVELRILDPVTLEVANYPFYWLCA
jgi:stage III sporulation protein SpoIIIAA